MTNVIIFVSHGQHKEGKRVLGEDKYALTQKGLDRSNEIGEMLRTIPNITGLYTSPLSSTMKTADCIFDVAEQNLPLQTMPSLANRGVSECWDSLQRRMVDFAERVNFDGIKVAVTHIQNIEAIVVHILGVDERAIKTLPIKIDYGTFTIIDFEHNQLRGVNFTKIGP